MKNIVKKFLLFILLISTCLISDAQNDRENVNLDMLSERGMRFYAVTGSFSSIGGDLYGNDKINDLSLNFDVKYFLIRNLGFGLDVDLERISVNNNQNTTYQQVLCLAPELTYFFESPGTEMIPYLSVNAGYITLGDGTGSINGTRLSGSGGFVIYKGRFSGLMEVGFERDTYSIQNANQNISGTKFFVGFGVGLLL